MASIAQQFAAGLVVTSVVALSTAAWAEPARLDGTVKDVFGSRFVVETTSGSVLVDIGPNGAEKVSVKPGDKIGLEGDRRDNELRAHRVTLADGHAYTVDRPSRNWRNWLTGRRTPGPQPSFDATQARTFATEKGYQVSADPVATRRHFRVMASKDGKAFELQVHRDGRVDPQPAFGEAEAQKLATDNGFQMTAKPMPTRRHYTVTASKDGKPYEVDLYRNGLIVARTPFGKTEAKQLATAGGFELVGEIRPVDEHFELLGRKEGTLYELHAHAGGKLIRARPVLAGDLRWANDLN